MEFWLRGRQGAVDEGGTSLGVGPWRASCHMGDMTCDGHGTVCDKGDRVVWGGGGARTADMQLSAKAVAVEEDQGSAASAFCALEVGPDWGCVGFEGKRVSAAMTSCTCSEARVLQSYGRQEGRSQ